MTLSLDATTATTATKAATRATATTATTATTRTTATTAKVVCKTRHAFALKVSRSPYANYDTSVHKFERCQKSSDNLPASISTPTPQPSRRHCAAMFSLSGWSAVTFRKLIPFLSIRKSKYQRNIASKMK